MSLLLSSLISCMCATGACIQLENVPMSDECKWLIEEEVGIPHAHTAMYAYSDYAAALSCHAPVYLCNSNTIDGVCLPLHFQWFIFNVTV